MDTDNHKYIQKNGDFYSIVRYYHGFNIYFATFKDFDKALEVKNKLIENGWDEEKIGLNINHIYKQGNDYNIIKILNNQVEYFGTFKSKEEAEKIEGILKKNNWNSEGIDIYSEYISFDGEKFNIEKYLYHNLINYGSFETLEEAVLYREELKENDWFLADNIPFPVTFNDKRNFDYFDNLILSPDGLIMNKPNELLKFKIQEIVNIYKEYLMGFDIKSLAMKHRSSPVYLEKIINSIEVGEFNQIFKEWKEIKKIYFD